MGSEVRVLIRDKINAYQTPAKRILEITTKLTEITQSNIIRLRQLAFLQDTKIPSSSACGTFSAYKAGLIQSLKDKSESNKYITSDTLETEATYPNHTNYTDAIQVIKTKFEAIIQEANDPSASLTSDQQSAISDAQKKQLGTYLEEAALPAYLRSAIESISADGVDPLAEFTEATKDVTLKSHLTQRFAEFKELGEDEPVFTDIMSDYQFEYVIYSASKLDKSLKQDKTLYANKDCSALKTHLNNNVTLNGIFAIQYIKSSFQGISGQGTPAIEFNDKYRETITRIGTDIESSTAEVKRLEKAITDVGANAEMPIPGSSILREQPVTNPARPPLAFLAGITAKKEGKSTREEDITALSPSRSALFASIAAKKEEKPTGEEDSTALRSSRSALLAGITAKKEGKSTREEDITA
ncbi:MAG: hypothetical protein HOM96_00650, partial [Rickettsiales bacterium]|nr:hypothetical protein [Rickettsiales bacterium]